MTIRLLILLCLLLPAGAAFSQTDQPAIGISFSGFVKTDVLFDTRQTVALREGHFLLYPSPVLPDVSGEDINAASSFNMLPIQSRLAGKITGPDALGAKTSGLLEAEFFGTSDADASGFRIRHAFLKMEWKRTSLLVGQFWHPMFVVEVFPGVVSFNTGVPFQPFSRNPQIRFTQVFGDVKLTLAAMSQRDFQSNGPTGFSSSYLRNAVVPNLHAQLQYATSGHIFGVGGDYKQLIPRIVTTRNRAAHATVTGFALLGYAKLALDPVTVKAEGTFGENLADHVMLGGYGVRTLDTATGVESYTALKCFSVWGEVSTGKELEFALFAGYTENLGAAENPAGGLYCRGTDIDNVFRLAPRVAWNEGKVRLAAEYEYTSAGYGVANLLDKGKVGNVTNVANSRLLLAAYFFF